MGGTAEVGEVAQVRRVATVRQERRFPTIIWSLITGLSWFRAWHETTGYVVKKYELKAARCTGSGYDIICLNFYTYIYNIHFALTSRAPFFLSRSDDSTLVFTK